MSDSNRIPGDCRHRAGFGEPCEECRKPEQKTAPPAKLIRVVTPSQYAEGYLVATWSDLQMPPIIRNRPFVKVGVTQDGNILVEEPDS